VAVAGFRAPGDLASAIFECGYSTPTLHVLGKNDIIVIEERARTLTDVSNVKRIVEHDGGWHHATSIYRTLKHTLILISVGHFVPSKGSWRKFFNEFFKHPEQLDLVPAPSLGAPASCTATPIDSGVATPVPTDSPVERSYASPS
jgi:hypothetical protein